MESKTRSLAKTISWRFIATFTTFVISWMISGDIIIGLSIASVEFWAKLILYYFHERFWNVFDWGTK
jgi:uncharacterized membrane protein